MQFTLYSFRRCPYAMRARLALRLSGQKIILREIVLKNKPAEMLAISPKATVPVLQLSTNQVLDESIDIAYWALQQNDPQNYLPFGEAQKITQQLLTECDGEFKHWLDHYKYADRFPDFPAAYYREKSEEFLQQIEQRLQEHPFLLGEQPKLADIAIFPFIRQWAFVDKAWFDQSAYQSVQRWLQHHLDSELFASIMQKVPVWESGQTPIYL